MVLLTLRFYASGSMIITVADFCGIDKSTACRIIHRVSDAIANLYKVFIKMPTTDEEINSKIFEFYQLSRFPQCIGAIDCTHIKIQSPGENDAEIFRNRKGYFSFNVQVVCDAHLKIQDIVCRWPGSSHDSTIFNNSRLKHNFEAGLYRNSLMVGDSGYPIRKYLMTPLSHPRTPVEHLFNESQIRTRNTIERFFGTWKRRFPILALGLRVKRTRIEAIVVATAILHNIAKDINVPEPDIPDDLRQIIDEDLAVNLNNNHVYFEQNDRLNNNVNRLSIIHNHFARLLQ